MSSSATTTVTSHDSTMNQNEEGIVPKHLPQQNQQQRQKQQQGEQQEMMDTHATTTTTTTTTNPSVMPRLVSGSIGSIVTALAVTPLEVVKVRQQLSPSVPSSAPSIPPSSVSPPPPSPPFSPCNNVKLCPRGCGTFVILNNGLIDCVVAQKQVTNPTIIKPTTITGTTPISQLSTLRALQRIFHTEGFGGVYAGLAPTLLMGVPNTVLYFTAYDEIITRLRQQTTSQQSNDEQQQDSSWWMPLLAGSSSRFLASAATAPLEFIRTRQAMAKSLNERNWVNELQSTVRQRGILSLYQGLGPTLGRDVPFSAIYWVCIERMKLIWKEKNKDHTASTVVFPPSAVLLFGQSFVNGAVAGMIAAALTTPFDVIKTRQQQNVAIVARNQVVNNCHHDGAVEYATTTHSASAAAAAATTNTSPKQQPISTTKSSSLQMMRQIVEEEGWSGLWRGNTTRMIKVAPACAIMISCYELGKRLMDP